MSTPDHNQLLLTQLLRITEKEANYLSKTTVRLQSQNPDLAWVQSLEGNDNRSEMLDAFVSRYSRLQDTLGDKLLRILLNTQLEKTGSQLDNLLRAEKLAWIESAQTWIELRELRNRLVHEYMDSAPDLLAALHQALQGVQVLTATQRRMAQVASRHARHPQTPPSP